MKHKMPSFLGQIKAFYISFSDKTQNALKNINKLLYIIYIIILNKNIKYFFILFYVPLVSRSFCFILL